MKTQNINRFGKHRDFLYSELQTQLSVSDLTDHQDVILGIKNFEHFQRQQIVWLCNRKLVNKSRTNAFKTQFNVLSWILKLIINTVKVFFIF